MWAEVVAFLYREFTKTGVFMRKILLVSTAIAGIAMAATSASAGTWVAAVPVTGSTSMSIFGINDQNTVAGDYVDTAGLTHGMTGPFTNDGTGYTSFDDSGGTTQPRAMNDNNYITGFDTGTLTPWERYPSGKIKNIVDKKGNPLNQLAQGMNSANVFAANSDNATTGLSFGYTGSKAKEKKAFKLSIANNGYAGRGIDAAGDIVGWFIDTTTNLQHGLLIIGGTATQFDVPNATYTVMEGLNDKGMASGQFEDSSGVIHGFILDIATSKITQLDAPGATLTQAWGINNNNVVAVSSSVGSFAYCVSKKNCPTAAGVIPGQSGKSLPARP
jgi:hypothetical protein